MRYLSICSGIESATVAWHPLGWQPVAFAEIEPFPCHVLHHHYGSGRPLRMPDPAEPGLDRKEARRRAAAIKAVSRLPETSLDGVPNLGDFTQIQASDLRSDIDLLVGGTPCQDFSVAGLRGGLAGNRGNLTLEFLRLAQRLGPRLQAGAQHGVALAFGGNDTSGPIDVATACNAHGGPAGRLDFESETFIAFDCKASGRNGFGEGPIAPTLRAMGHKHSHTNAGGQIAVAFDTTQITSGENRSNPQPGDPRHSLAKGAHAPAIAIGDTDWRVRRLTPRECERLMGFPDDYTLVPYGRRVAAEDLDRLASDGPRYKALGNSKAVNCVEWLGERIDMVAALFGEREAA